MSCVRATLLSDFADYHRGAIDAGKCKDLSLKPQIGPLKAACETWPFSSLQATGHPSEQGLFGVGQKAGERVTQSNLPI